MRLTLDTNVLIYSVAASTGEKHQRAVDLVERAAKADCVLTLQSLAEFFHVSTRKFAFTPAKAGRYVADWCSLFPIHAADGRCLHHAIGMVAQHGIAFWDAMLCAAANQAGCRVLLSEDLQDGRAIERIRIINPFRESNATLIETALPPLP